jgi:diguanylate cyclase (GGDEF)-like protein
VSLGPTPDPSRTAGPASGADARTPARAGSRTAPSIRRTWWLLAGSFLFLAVVVGARAVFEGQALDWLVVVTVAVAAIAAVGHRNAVAGLEANRRAEAESYARLLRGLSRSISADSIVGAIMDDLVDATGADHVAVVRRREDGSALDATLVTRRPGIPATTAPLPITDLEGPFRDSAATPVAIAIEGDGLEPVARPLAAGAVVPAMAAASTGDAGATIDATPAASRRAGALPPGVGARPVNPAIANAPAPASPSRAPSWLTDPPGGLPRSRGATVQDRAVVIASSAIREGAALLRDLGVPLPAPASERGAAPVAEVLASGLDAAVTDRIGARVRASFGLSQTLAAPIRTEQGLIGAIVLSRRDRAPWPDAARRLLFSASRETATALERATTLREATAQASTDPLTGLPNRRYFDEFCGLLARRRRSGDAVAALMIDIDHFKRLNETYGHPVGDAVLKRVATAIATTVRDEDVPARVGGEEFAVLLRNPGPDVAVDVGERVRRAVRSIDLHDVGVDAVSVSVGVANALGPDEPIPDLIDRADQALRKAKRSGRDRVIAAT